MSSRNQIYLAGLAMYVVASLAGFFVDAYWLVLIASLLIVVFTVNRVFNNNNEENLYDSMKFDWISIFAFAGVELILTFCISLLSLPLVGFIGYLNLGVQILGYIFIGYSVVRYVLANTSAYQYIKEKVVNVKPNTEVIIEDTSKEEVSTKVEEAIQEEIKKEVFEDVQVVGETCEPEVKTIELKKEEKEIFTPYMEEEI